MTPRSHQGTVAGSAEGVIIPAATRHLFIGAEIAATPHKWQKLCHGDAPQKHSAWTRSARRCEPAGLALLRPGILRGGEARLPPRIAAGGLPRKRDHKSGRMADDRFPWRKRGRSP